MAEEVKQYINTIKTGGLQITEPRPIDDRLNVVDEAAVIESFLPPYTEAENNFTAVLYDGMVIKSNDTKITYIWVESDYGLLINGYTYPPYDLDYGGKTFDFVIYDSIVKITKSYDGSEPTGILIENSLLPYHISKDKDTATVMFKSNKTGFSEIEFPDKLEITSEGIRIVIDPIPELLEEFKITIM